MMEEIAKKSGESLWKEVGEKAIKKAVTTFVGEGIKAVVEIWKERHMKELDIEFKEREKARKQEAGDSDDSDEPEADALDW